MCIGHDVSHSVLISKRSHGDEERKVLVLLQPTGQPNRRLQFESVGSVLNQTLMFSESKPSSFWGDNPKQNISKAL